MRKDPRKAEKWPPAKSRWPAGFTPTKDGWVTWYNGRTRYVCGKNTPRKEVDDRWQAKKREIDAGAAVAKPTANTITLREATSLFLADMRARVKDGKPRRLSKRSLHNYIVELNRFGKFIGGDVRLSDITSERFNAFTDSLTSGKEKMRLATFDTVVVRVSTLFTWAVKRKFLKEVDLGVRFVRPSKQDMAEERMDRVRSFTPEEIGKLWGKANLTTRCWIALGLCCGFNNSDIGNLPRSAIDLDAGIIDFRRRKTGRKKRICPLPADVVRLLRSYEAPPPVAPEFADLFFRTRSGNPFVTSDNASGKPTDQIAYRFWKLVREAGVTEYGKSDGRNFAGLRTTFGNLCPSGDKWEGARDIIMGHAKGVFVESYLERIGTRNLFRLVNHVWKQIAKKLPLDLESPREPDEPAEVGVPPQTELAEPCAAQ